MVKLLFFYQFDTAEGMTLSTLGIDYQGFSATGGLLMVMFDFVFWLLLGLYLD